MPPTPPAWFDTVSDLTWRLVAIRSVSPGEGENEVARGVIQMLTEGGLEEAYTSIGLDPIVGDATGRHNAYAWLRGQSARTVVLLGHIDTVDTTDYGQLEAYACDPDALDRRIEKLAALTPDLADDLLAHPGDWAFGRGILDMKSGDAANIAVMRRLAALHRTGELPLSIVLLACPDEENESAGVFQAVRFLLRLREEHGLDYVGCINTDYTTYRHPGDPNRYVYTGSIGKLLPTFLVVGQESHVGDPFNGVDANLLAAELIQDFSMNPELCDFVRGQVTPPPVTLKSTDLKVRYNVQIPFAAYFYLNVLTFDTGPGALLDRLCERSRVALRHTLSRIDAAERAWRQPLEDAPTPRQEPRTGAVLTYAELYATAVEKVGLDLVTAELDAEWSRRPADLDKRERCLHLVWRLWTLSGGHGPAVILYYSPPYYPSVPAVASPLHEAVAGVAAAHPELKLKVAEYYPFLSDMSYLRLKPDTDLTALTVNMPIWQDRADQPRPGAYSLPLAGIAALDLPVINIGPYGAGAHQRGERVLASYSFGVLPQIIYETISALGSPRLPA